MNTKRPSHLELEEFLLTHGYSIVNTTKRVFAVRSDLLAVGYTIDENSGTLIPPKKSSDDIELINAFFEERKTYE